MEFLTNKEIAAIIDRSESTASRLRRTMRDAMKIKRKEVTIDEISMYLDLEPEKVKLKLHKK